MSYSTDSPPTMVGRFELELLIGIHEESKGVSDETSILSLLEKKDCFSDVLELDGATRRQSTDEFDDDESVVKREVDDFCISEVNKNKIKIKQMQ